MRTRKETGDLGFITCPLTGRVHAADHGKEYALVNYVTQGFAAQLFKMKIIELDNAGLGNFMTIPVHDEIMLDVPKENEMEVVEALKDIMNDDQIISVPVTAGIAHGARWGEKEDYEH
jgi:DNA polymerase I